MPLLLGYRGHRGHRGHPEGQSRLENNLRQVYALSYAHIREKTATYLIQPVQHVERGACLLNLLLSFISASTPRGREMETNSKLEERFARSLASNDTRTRSRTLKRLTQWVVARSSIEDGA